MATIKKIKRDKGTVYKAEVRLSGHQYTSKTLATISAARAWAKDTEKIMRMSEQNEVVLTMNDRLSALSDEIEELKIELQQLKELIKKQ